MNSSAGVRVETGGAHMCDMCSRTFAEPEPLALHYRRVHAGGERPFECKVCSKSFTSTRSLVAHRRVHTREKSYRCSHCDGKFVRSSTLQRHLLVHTGERPHRCTDCGKSFIQSFQLVLHMRSHTGEKPYVCSVCCKGFASAQRLKVHSRTHSRERPFACDFCDEAFTYRQGLKLHLMVHFGSRRLYASKKAFEDLIANGLSETPKKSTLFQQEDSSAAVVSSSFTSNSSSTTNPYDVGDDMTNRIEKCLNSSPPQELNGVSKSLSVGKISLRSDLFLPYDPRNHPRYTNNEKNHRQLSVSMLFGCSATVNQTNTDCRAKQLESNSNLQRSQELKQIQGCLNNKNYSKAKHYDFDSIQFRHIPPLIPIDSDSRHFLDGQS